MDIFYKLAAVLFVCCVIAILCGVISTAEKEGELQNVTPVTLTVGSGDNTAKEPTVKESNPVCVNETPAVDNSIQTEPAVMTDESSDGINDTVKEQMQEKELEQMNNDSDQMETTTSDDGLVSLDMGDETNISPAEQPKEQTIDKPMTTENKLNREVKDKSIIKKTVNASGFIFVGTQYAGEDVEIIVLDK